MKDAEQAAMRRSSGFGALQAIAWTAALLSCWVPGGVRADDAGPYTKSAAALGARFAALGDDALTHNQFRQPLHLVSKEGADGVTGEILALIDAPFAVASGALSKASQWCDIMILHLNTKYCRPVDDGRGTVLHVRIGKKYQQPVADAFRVDLVYRVAARTANYLQVNLNAAEGPLTTRDYRIVLEAAPGEDGRTQIRLSYAYSYGTAAALAMRAYLATVGRSKVGFTVVGRQANNQPDFIGGMRGLVERNTMRYYMAIEAYLGALSALPVARMEKSLRDWFAATERYPRQLRELEEGEYLEIKRNEYARQHAETRN